MLFGLEARHGCCVCVTSTDRRGGRPGELGVGAEKGKFREFNFTTSHPPCVGVVMKLV